MRRFKWRNAGRAEMNGSGLAIRGGGECEVVVEDEESPSCLTNVGAWELDPGEELNPVVDALESGLLKRGDVYDSAGSADGPSSAGAKKVGK